MKKIIHNIFLIILFITINGCGGYKPIFKSQGLEFKIIDHSIEGNKLLGNKIYSKIYNIAQSNINVENSKKINLFINVSKDKQATSKSNSGKILNYKITLISKIKATDSINGKNILSKTFSSSISYKVQDRYSDSIKIENKSTQDLINKTFQEFLILFSKNLKTQ